MRWQQGILTIEYAKNDRKQHNVFFCASGIRHPRRRRLSEREVKLSKMEMIKSFKCPATIGTVEVIDDEAVRADITSSEMAAFILQCSDCGLKVNCMGPVLTRKRNNPRLIFQIRAMSRLKFETKIV